MAVYKVEPYVIAADVYAVQPHTGRGGWTWYTGAAGWYYRLIVESLLGIAAAGDTLHIAPCMRDDWDELRPALPLRRDALSHQGPAGVVPPNGAATGSARLLDGADLGDAAAFRWSTTSATMSSRSGFPPPEAAHTRD